jgi:hypothetical protein
MYHHIARGLTDLARSLRVSRFRKLTPNEIDLIEQGGLKLAATLDALELSRQSNQLLQRQLDRLKELVPEDTMQILLSGTENVP